MTGIARRGLCLVLSAPSGAGKTAITQALLAREPELRLSVSVTTRTPRANEQDGVHYHFRDKIAFDALVAENGLLEWATVLGRHSYGTPRAPVEQALADGLDMIFDIDWQGYRQLRAALPGDVVGVFVLPPSMSELEQRLRARAGDHPEEIARRMALAHAEVSHWPEYDHVILNRDLTHAVADVGAVLHAARLATKRQPGLRDFVASLSQAPETHLE